jgi:Flp pilus assembly protein TadD
MGILGCLYLLTMSGCLESNIKKGTMSLQLGDYTMAMEFFGQELKKNPQSYEARLGMGKALIQQAVDHHNDTTSWKQALINLTAARTVRPQSDITPFLSQAWSIFARNLLAKSDTIEALSALARAIEYNSYSVEPLNTAGIIYFRSGEMQKAAVLFNQALSLDSTHASALFNLGMVYWTGNNIGKAHYYWLKALKNAPNDDDILYWFARAEKIISEQ